MKTSRLAVLLTLTVSTLIAANPGITLVGTGFVPGDSLDLSGLTGNHLRFEQPSSCISRATLGGFGSGIYLHRPRRCVSCGAGTAGLLTGSPLRYPPEPLPFSAHERSISVRVSEHQHSSARHPVP